MNVNIVRPSTRDCGEKEIQKRIERLAKDIEINIQNITVLGIRHGEKKTRLKLKYYPQNQVDFGEPKKRKSKIKEADYKFIMKRDKMICHICKKYVALKDLNFDHVIPLCKGGEHSNENIKVSHSWCNIKKHCKIIY